MKPPSEPDLTEDGTEKLDRNGRVIPRVVIEGVASLDEDVSSLTTLIPYPTTIPFSVLKGKDSS